MMPEVSAPFARYEVESTLGQGGKGAVYRARDRATGNRVALKRLTAPSKSTRSVTVLFEREFHTLTQLSHPAVVRVFDYGVDEQGPYYTMELLDGSDLRGKGDLTSNELCEILCGVASALSLLHSRRLVHRDVTSGNIRLVGPGRAKLIDFGALAPFGPSDRFVGTPQYAPPEAVLLQPLDGRADLYSLGVVMYRTLTGRYPYRARVSHPIWIRANLGAHSSVVGVAALGFDDASQPEQAVHALAAAFGDFLVQVGDTIVSTRLGNVTRVDTA